MPHGAPDWYKYRRDSATYPVDDLAELAVRLDSIASFDRRGDVVFLDSFKDGRRTWQHSGSGTGTASALSPAYFLSNGYSLAVTCPKDSYLTAAVHRYAPHVPHGAIGLEVAFTLALYITSFKLDLTIHDGQTQILTSLLYTYATQRLQYTPQSGASVDLDPTIRLTQNPRIFNHLKLVVDPDTLTYKRAILNHQPFPMTDIPVRHYTGSSFPYLLINAQWIGTVDYNPVVYLDNVIITQDEP